MILTDRPLRYGTPVQLALFSDLISAVTQNGGVVHWCRTHQHGWQIGIFLTMPLPNRLTEREWSDLRASLRYDCNWKAWVHWEHDGQLEPVWISNYSVGGLCMTTTRALPAGSKFSLFGAAGANGRAVLNGEIQWTRETEDGVATGCLIHGKRGRDLPRMFGKLDAVHVSAAEREPSYQLDDSLDTQNCELAALEQFLTADTEFGHPVDEYSNFTDIS